METDAGRYVPYIERIAVRVHGGWQWFDSPVITRVKFQQIASEVLELQAQRAANAVGVQNCLIVRVRMEGEETPVDWDTCLHMVARG